MNRILVGIALAGALWGCESKSAPPPVAPPPVVAVPAPVPAPAAEPKVAVATYTERVKIDDV
jgi:hypothetical protein